jgi:uncharacterized protein
LRNRVQTVSGPFQFRARGDKSNVAFDPVSRNSHLHDIEKAVRYLYAHGFASSPQSNKARAFEAAFAKRSIRLEIPALDGGDFERLTISGQMKILSRTLKNEPNCLIGSSMGGLLAALYASTHLEVSRLVLLAPAFGFAQRWRGKAGNPPPKSMQVYHYGENRMREIRYDLIEDALKYPGAPGFTQPALIFHGSADQTVPIEISRNWAASHPNVRLVEVDSDHELLSVLDQIVGEAVPFLLA